MSFTFKGLIFFFNINIDGKVYNNSTIKTKHFLREMTNFSRQEGLKLQQSVKSDSLHLSDEDFGIVLNLLRKTVYI